MILVVEQPSYIPWLGYFDLMAQSDVWVWYDDVQYTRRDWRNRNRLARDGVPTWLTVPVKNGGQRRLRIADVEIDVSRPWQRKHLETLRHCCGQAPCYPAVAELFATHLARTSGGRLADLVIGLNEAIARRLGLATRFLRSSTLPCAGDRTGRLLALCSAVGAETYLSGPRARSYVDPGAFRSAGVDLRYIVYGYPPYPRGSLPFVPDLSILDPLAWLGFDGTARLLRADPRWEPGC